MILTLDQRKRWLCQSLANRPANGFANASALTAWAKMSPTPAACSRRTPALGVQAQGHSGIGVAEPGRDNVDRDACQQQGCRVQVAQVVEPCVGEWPGWGSGRFVVSVDQLGHERGHGVGVERFAPSAGEDQAAGVVPG